MKVRANISLKRDEIKDLCAYYLGFEIGTAVPNLLFMSIYICGCFLGISGLQSSGHSSQLYKGFYSSKVFC